MKSIKVVLVLLSIVYAISCAHSNYNCRQVYITTDINGNITDSSSVEIKLYGDTNGLTNTILRAYYNDSLYYTKINCNK